MPLSPSPRQARLPRLLPVLFLALPALAQAQDLGKLPAWARPHAEAAAAEAPPVEADAWVLFERTEFGYRGDNEVSIRKYRLVKVLTEQGLDKGKFQLWGLGGSVSRIRKLKGWNLRPDGEVTRLDKDDLVTVGMKASTGGVSSMIVTYGALDRVAKGSYIAFESQETLRGPMGALDKMLVFEADPIRTWELEMSTSLGLFTRSDESRVKTRMDCRHFRPWFPEPAPDATVLRLSHLPALPRNESGHRNFVNVLPTVDIKILDATDPGTLAVATWEELGARIGKMYPVPKQPIRPVDLTGKTGRAALEAIHTWLQREFTYKQIYLTPERGWVPAPAEEVLRSRFGDCKDLANFFIGAVQGAGMEAYPVLARIVDGVVDADSPVTPFAFNHAIAAVRLEATLGLPSEVVTSQGRFLLVDATDRFSPLGYLSKAHQGGRVLICTPKGATLSEIPPQATVPEGVHFALDADLTAQGILKGTLEIRTGGGALGLSSTLLQGGAKALKKTLAEVLDFPPGSTWSITSTPDPLDGQKALTVRIAFERPQGLVENGREFLLANMGLPGASAPIQRKGKARFYPVYLEPSCPWEYEAHIRTESSLRPLTPSASLDTPLRTATWSLETQGGALHLHFAQTRKGLDLPYEAREEGVRIQKDDRRRFGTFLEDALSVTKLP